MGVVSIMLDNFKSLLRNFFYSMKRYPLASLSAFIVTILSIYLVENSALSKDKVDFLSNIALTSTLAFFIFIALGLISSRTILSLIGVILSLGYFFSLPNSIDMESFDKHIILMFISFIFILTVPFLEKNVHNEKFWSWIYGVFLALLSSLIFGGILFGGLAGAISASTQLFGFSVDGKYYAEVAFVVFGLFSTHYFIAQLPHNPHTMQSKEFEYRPIETFFTNYILLPLSIIYAFILIGYGVKIVITSTVPNGMIVWLSLAFATLSFITYMFLTLSTHRFKKLLLITIAMQMLLLFASLYLRIDEYGWSANRYMTGVAGVWFFIISIYLLLKPNYSYRNIFLFLASLLLISQYGGPLSASSISKFSQGMRLATLLQENKNLSNDTNIDIRCKISGAIGYLDTHHEKKTLEKIIPSIVKSYDENQSKDKEFSSFATQALGFSFVNDYQCSEMSRKNSNIEALVPYSIRVDSQFDYSVNIKGYDWMDSVDVYSDPNLDYSSPLGGTDELNITIKNPNILVIKKEQNLLGEFNLTSFSKDVLLKVKSVDTIPLKEFVFTGDSDKIAIRIYFDSLDVYKVDGNVSGLSGKLLWKEK